MHLSKVIIYVGLALSFLPAEYVGHPPIRAESMPEPGNILAEAHFTGNGWQSTGMQIGGNYTDRLYEGLHLAQLRQQQHIVIRFQKIEPSSLVIRHSGTYFKGKTQTLINVSVNDHLIDQAYPVPGHGDPSALNVLPEVKSWQISKWINSDENVIKIFLHPSAATVYWIKDVWVCGMRSKEKLLKRPLGALPGQDGKSTPPKRPTSNTDSPEGIQDDLGEL